MWKLYWLVVMILRPRTGLPDGESFDSCCRSTGGDLDLTSVEPRSKVDWRTMGLVQPPLLILGVPLKDSARGWTTKYHESCINYRPQKSYYRSLIVRPLWPSTLRQSAISRLELVKAFIQLQVIAMFVLIAAWNNVISYAFTLSDDAWYVQF